jgi:hypothetical protein
MNNATILAADRTTHLKIAAISLVSSIVVSVIAVMAHTAPTEGMRVAGDASAPAIKAGRPYLMSRSETNVIR